MPGIFGGYLSGNLFRTTLIAEEVVKAINPENRYRVDKMISQAGFFLGRAALGLLNDMDQPVLDTATNCCVIFHGELYGESSSKDPQQVLSGYLLEGVDSLKNLSGIFHGAIHDPNKHRLMLFNDKFGLQPLYYALARGGVLFAGEIKPLLVGGLVSRQVDPFAIADFLHYGQLLGNRTLFEEIKLLPPGSVLSFDMDSGAATVQSYWKLEDLFAPFGRYDIKTDLEPAVSLFISAVKKRTRQKELLGLSLSGGLDSRGILASLGETARDLHTYTLGLPGCADERLARRMARHAGTRHTFIGLESRYFEDFEQMASTMIKASDGMYHPHESTELAALEYFKSSPFKILLRGHGGELAKAALAYPVMVRPEVHGMSNGKQVLDYIFRTANLVSRDIDMEELVQPAFRQAIHEGPRQSLQTACGSASELLAPPDLCLFYYINQHIRRQVVASLEIFRTRIEIRMPYVDEDYAGALFRLPVRFRNTGEFHRKLVARCNPGLMRIPDSNTGAPMDAGMLRLLVTDKCTSLLKRLSIPGFRHYTEYQRWHRESFRDASRKIIFSDQTKSRNIYNMEVLRTLFDLHVTGKKNYAHLLGTIVGIEFWHRIFVD